MKGLFIYMKKLLLPALAALIFMPITKADAGYALFEQKRLLPDNEMNNPHERTEQEKQKLEEKMSGDKTPKFSGIG